MLLRRSIVLAYLSVCLIVLIAAPSFAQTGAISGWVKTSSGQICGEDEVRACIQHESTTSQPYPYGRIYWDGIYKIPEAGTFHDGREPNMYPGVYAVGMSDEYEWRPRNYSYVNVYNGQITTCNITIPETYGVRGQDGTTPSYHSIGQTFVAKGGSLQRMTLWLVPFSCTITVREGGPAGPIVGSPKSIPANSPTVTWMYGEIPTVAGQTYYIEFYSDGGNFHTYRRSGNPYPQGQAYYNGVAQSNLDLTMTLFEDCDGQASMYHVHLAGTSQTNFFSGHIGQTFKARGRNILSASFRFRTGDGSAREAVFTIHLGGPAGPQIGPSKATKVYDYGTGQKVTATWLPGEVPTTVGTTYYVKVASAGLYVWCSANSIYPDGSAYDGGTVVDGDLIGTIMGEVEPGSSTCTVSGTVRDANGNLVSGARIDADTCGYYAITAGDGTYSLKMTGDIYNLMCSKAGHETQYVNNYNATAGTLKTLDWILPAPGVLAGFVRDNVGNPVQGASVTANPGGYSATSGSNGYYAMTAILPGTYSVTASRAGYYSQTKTGIVVNQGSTTTCDFNLLPISGLINPGFEDHPTQAVGWTSYGHGLFVWDIIDRPTPFGGVTPHGGRRYALEVASWTDPKTGGAYQRIQVPVNTPIMASVWAACCGHNGGAAHTFSRLGLDPAGGTNPASGSVQWTPWYNSPADNYWEWTQLTKMATSTSNFVTLFLDYVQQSSGGGYAYALQLNTFDDAAIEVPGELISVPEARKQSDHLYSYLGPGVITAKFSESPACFYVEAPDRSAGLKVSGTTHYSIGDAVRVGGTMQTASGERYVQMSFAELAQAGYGALDPLGMTMRNIGGSADGPVPGVVGGVGLNNVGLLVKAWGRVTHIDSTSFHLDDGSGTPLRVTVTSTSDMPANNSYAVVTGISSTYESGGVQRLLRARSGGVTSY